MENKKLDKLRDDGAWDKCSNNPSYPNGHDRDMLFFKKGSDHMREAHLPLVEALKDITGYKSRSGVASHEAGIAVQALIDAGYLEDTPKPHKKGKNPFTWKDMAGDFEGSG